MNELAAIRQRETCAFHPTPSSDPVRRKLFRRRLLASVTLLAGVLAASAAVADGGTGGASSDNAAGGSGGTASSLDGDDGSGTTSENGGGGGGGAAGGATVGTGGDGGGYQVTGTGGGGQTFGANGEQGLTGQYGGGGGGGAGGQHGSYGSTSDFTGTSGGSPGGNGGQGGQPLSGTGGSGGGGGGEGGYGAVTSAGTVTSSTTLSGGEGGAGGNAGGPGAEGGVGGDGGIGVELTGGGTSFTNTGDVTGGGGGNSGVSGALIGVTGGSGGAGVLFSDGGTPNATLMTSGSVVGGQGGTGGIGTPIIDLMGQIQTDTGGTGGAGGAGVIFIGPSAYATVQNDGTVRGGAGGSGADSTYGTSGAGGAGGAGILFQGEDATATVESGGSVIGGAGGSSGQDGTSNYTGAGGAGGAGIVAEASNGSNRNTISINSGGSVSGGVGGVGVTPGEGGVGILAANADVTVAGTVAGSAGVSGTYTGAGGAGIVAEASNGSNRNTISINSGGSVSGGVGGVGVTPGEGGAGILAANTDVTVAGTVAGGVGGSGTADAVRFTGGTNTLTLRSGYSLTGNAVAYSASDSLRLGGTETTGTFNVSTIGSSSQFRDFGKFEKVDGGTWTLTGTTTEVTPWTISEGTLQISDGGSLGDASGTLTLAGSNTRLSVTDDATVTNGITVSGTNTGITVADGKTLTYTGALNNTYLIKDGLGTFSFEGTSADSGSGLAVNAGTLRVSSSMLGNVTVNSGGTLAGTGSVIGAEVKSGGILAPGGVGSAGTFTTTSNYVARSGSITAFDLGMPGVVGGANNDLVSVGGSLALQGIIKLTLTQGGTYTLFQYGAIAPTAMQGTVVEGLAGVTSASYSIAGSAVAVTISASAGNQVWDGGNDGPHGGVNGGSGTWSTAGTNWTDLNRLVYSAFGGGTAYFAYDAGTVTVEGTQSGGALRFLSDYTLTGGTLDVPTYSVADGITATVASTLATGTTITKVDDGTVDLSGTNGGFDADVTVEGGTLRVSGTLGLSVSNTGDTSVEGGTLEVTGTYRTDELKVGAASADATLKVLSYGDLISGATILGQTASSSVTVDGDGSTWTAGDITLSDGSTAYITVSNQGKLTADSITFGSSTGIAKSLTVTGSGSTLITDALVIHGGSGVNPASFNTGAKVETGTAILAKESGTTGSAVVTGTGTVWTVNGGSSSDGLQVGGEGSAALTVADNATLTVASGTPFTLGASDGGSGELKIGGSGGTPETPGTVNADTLTFGSGSGVLIFNHTGTAYTFDTVISGGSGASATIRSESGATKLTADSSGFTGDVVVDGGTLAITGQLGSSSGAMAAVSGDTATVLVSGAGAEWEVSGDLVVAGFGIGTLAVSDGGVLDVDGSLTLAKGLSWSTRGTGTLVIGGATTAAAAGTVEASAITTGAGLGTVRFNHTSTDYDFGVALSGSGNITQDAGTTKLTADNSGFTGRADVSGGTLLIDNAYGGYVTVKSGGTLGGTGTIAESVTVQSGGTIAAGNSPGTLAIGGNLTLNDGSTSKFELGTPGVIGGSTNDLITVGQNLALDGTLDATVASSGFYRLFSVTGSTGGTFDTVTVDGVTNGSGSVYLEGDNVNLFAKSDGQVVQFWDGSNTTANGTVDGGDGTWNASTTNWTGAPGEANINAPWQSSVGVFAGTAGTVTVSGTQAFDTLQFTVDGYSVTGGTLAISPASGSAGTINVDSGLFATVGSTIADGTGTSLSKVGAGTLVLTGTNRFSGGVSVEAGTLSISAGNALGSGGLSVSDATLAVTGSAFYTDNVVLGGTTSTFDIASGQELELIGRVSGSGTLTKTSAGTLKVTQGGSGLRYLSVDVDAGTLDVSGGLLTNLEAVNVDGSLRVTNGGGFGSDSSIGIADASGSTGSATVSGRYSSLFSKGSLTVGGDGTGTLTVEDGGSVGSDTDLSIGKNAGSTGSKVTVTGVESNGAASELDLSSKSLYVGNAGSGELSVEDGGSAESYYAYLGYHGSGSSGTVTVSGVNASGTRSTAAFTGSLYVGYQGKGTVKVEDGAALSSGSSNLGFEGAGSSGIVTVTGVNATSSDRSSWDVTGDLTVGNQGYGELNIEDGALVTSGTSATPTTATIGLKASGVGKVTVGGVDPASGDAATWNHTGTLTVGDAGEATLTIEDGGQVSSTDGTIGDGGQSNDSRVLVSGVNGTTASTWTTTGGLTVGNAGAGTLTIAEGGAVDVGTNAVTLGSQSTGTGTLVIGAASGQTAVAAGTLTAASVAFGSGTGTLVFNHTDTAYSFGPSLSGGTASTATLRHESGTTTLTADNAGFAGTTSVDGGTLKVTNAHGGPIEIGTNGTFELAQSTDRTFANTITGLGTLAKSGSAATTLSADNSAFAGKTSVTAGTLKVSGALGGGVDISSGATYELAQSTDRTFSTVFTGTGALKKSDTGTTTLTGTSAAFAGTTTVAGGTLLVNGTLGASSAKLNVGNGGTLGGTGTVGGLVQVQSGGTLSAGTSPGTLTVNGNLELDSGSTSTFELNASGVLNNATNDLVSVTGDLTLGGTLEASVASSGYYRLFDYGGTLQPGSFGTTTVTGVASATGQVQTGIDHEVNLIVASSGQVVQFWDGSDMVGNGTVDGGAGTWSAANTNWTGQLGEADINGSWVGSVGVFMGTAGAVTVSGSQAIDTLQFKTDGYELTGGSLAISPASGSVATINVDGGVTTTIGSSFVNGTQGGLAKVGSGTLILTGSNTHTGGTLVSDGVLSVGADAALGGSTSSLALSGGMLATTASFDTTRAVSVSGSSGIDVASTTTFKMGGTLTGAGALTKTGDGTLEVSGDGSGFTGGVDVNGGTLAITGQLATGSMAIGRTTGSSGTLVVDGASASWSNSGSLRIGMLGDGAVEVKNGASLTTNGLILSRKANSTGNYGSGSLTVTGSTTEWTNDGGGQLGYDDTSTSSLTISKGATAKLLTTGLYVGKNGTVLVTNSGTSLTTNNAGDIQNGAWFSMEGGTATVSDGASLTTDGGYIGGSGTRLASMMVTGGKTTWSAPVRIYVGGSTGGAGSGLGMLTVSDGATVSTATGGIGMDAGSTGTFVLAGSGTTFSAVADPSLNALGNVYVSYAGDATATVSDGAALSADNEIRIATVATGTGTLNVGAAMGSAAAAAGSLSAPGVVFGAGTGTLVLNHTAPDFSLASAISGTGTIEQVAGTSILTGTSTGFTGTTNVTGGSLLVNGTLGGTSSTLTVASGALLGGSGTVGGSVTVDGTLSAGNSPGTLTVGGDLTLGTGSASVFELGTPGVQGGSTNDFVSVGRNLTLGGTLSADVAASGYYYLFGYGGTLSGSFATTTVTGVDDITSTVDTDVEGQVNLSVVTGGQLLQFWDGSNTGQNGTIDGGSGTWNATSTNWTDTTGTLQQAWAASVGVFTGTAGTVAVDGTQSFDTLQFKTDGYLLTGGALALSPASGTYATFNVDGGVTTRIGSSVVDGTASSFRKVGTGTLIFLGTNTYAGPTQVEAGTLVGDTNSLKGDIQNAGTVEFAQGSDGTFAGTVEGLEGTDGSMVKSGGGTLTLTGTSTLPWTIEEGGVVSTTELFLGDLTVAEGAMMTFDQSFDGEYAGAFSGTGELLFEGGGQVTLTGDASGYTGALTVQNFTLRLDGPTSGSFIIDQNGRLAGNGSVGPTIVRTGGTIAPGNSIGTVAVIGDLVFEAGSSYEVETEPGGTDADLIQVSGTVTIEGGEVVHIGFDGNYAPEASYTILTADGGITGTFAAVSSELAFLDPTLAYSSTAVMLQLVRNDIGFSDVAVSTNQRDTANAVESLGSGNAVYDAVVTLDDADARTAFDALSGEIHASLKTGLVEDSRFVRDAAMARVRSAFSALDAKAPQATAYGGEGAVGPAPFAAWAQGFGSWGETDGNGNAAKLDRDTAGVLVGGDAAIGPYGRAGFVAGYQSSTYEADARSSKADATTYQLGIYGGTEFYGFGVRGGAAYGWSDIDTARTASFSGYSDYLTGSTSAGTGQAFGEVGYELDAGIATFEPFAGLSYVSVHTDGYTETGGSAALSVASDTTEVTYSTLGLRASTELPLGGLAMARISGLVGWRHAYGSLDPTATNVFSTGSPFIVDGVPIAEDVAVIGAGLEIDLGANPSLGIAGASLGISYDGQFGSGAMDNAAQGRLTIQF